MRWLTFSSNLVKEINTLPEFFLFQRFPKQVKGGFLIEGGTSRLALRGDSLRRKIELKKTLDGICSITAYNASKSCCFLQFWRMDGHYMVTEDTLQHKVKTNLFKAILAAK